ncbi:tyrosine-protein kinase [Nesidiocoris tenuis]|uniref:Tyrosine-protein kinase n=2 Tax=Nesidiocoris tenuis TaxID=355587 RepID=A0ABN7AZD6_9HEMI|nr:tyrosine-protein kinase [Nesidiocoris tenuis]
MSQVDDGLHLLQVKSLVFELSRRLNSKQMGFSAQLQTKAAHEALLSRQDAELRLLETMRRCISNKVKCDKDYATALSSISALGQKNDRAEEMSNSLVGRAWRGMMEEVEAAAKLFRSKAEIIEKETLDKVNTLCQEKRKARKIYLEEYNRITQKFTNICDEVNRKKSDYQKQLESYRFMRSRFEEYYVKSGRGGRKLEDVQDKYQRACRRLHLIHNEYVLLLSEAEQVQKDVKSHLLPALFSHYQTNLQSFIVNWRSIMKEISLHWNCASKQFVDVWNRSEAHVETIVPANEYVDLQQKQMANGTDYADFTFDNSLVEDTSGKLQANTLTVDNLTVEWVRNKMLEVEPKLKDCQERLSNKNPDLQDMNEVAIAELRCEEKKLTRQLEVIKKALTELGCEEAPPGCDIPLNPLLDGSQEISVDSNPEIGRKLSHPSPPPPPTQPSFVDILRKPFRRKSVPSSPLGTRHNQGTSRSLVDEDWFHGVLPREEVVRLLTREGDFLVRETTRNDENQTVLSVCWGGHKHFIVQTTAEGQFRFEGPAFNTIQELITYQIQSQLPVTGRSGAILRTPIPRERWELNNDDVVLGDKIGRGNFGDVFKGRLLATNEEVAIKTCRVTVAEEHKRKFLQEGRILKQYDHPNIVKLIGICVQKQPIMIVMELVVGGSLLTHLRTNASSVTTTQLINMCRDAAAGMRYLESKNCIHRDLAARNCLVGDKNIVKISDFGMSREEEEYIVSDGMKQIPIKWTAPEALNFGKYTTLCDVWSYGVLCWEIFAKGGVPYPGMSNSKAREKIDAGYRMPAPDGTPEDMYRLMLRCWEYQPELRPHFDQILNIVENILGTMR